MTEVYDWKVHGDGTFSLYVDLNGDTNWKDYGSCFRIQYQFDLGLLTWMGSGAQPDWLSLAGLDA
tara:strand:+ start:5943 stop:6137 length:195 start_codon:yes stop_codon:yes gene_type:complete